MKKQTLLIIMTIVISIYCFADNRGVVESAVTNYLFPDRIRNVFAVSEKADPGPSKNKIYAISFGLVPYNANIPNSLDGEEAYLAKFNIKNHLDYWKFTNLQVVQFDHFFESANNINLNGYDSDDLDQLTNEYPENGEGQARYDGASGCWASPVLFEEDMSGYDKLIILNKSGIIMSIETYFTSENYANIVDWDFNLRQIEREIYDFNEHYKYEYMATPVVIDNFVYVTGIHTIFRINLNDETISHIHISNLSAHDHFIAPLAYDFSNPLNLIAVSKLGKVVIVNNWDITDELQLPNDGRCYAKPLISENGQIYIPSSNGEIYYLEQEITDINPTWQQDIYSIVLFDNGVNSTTSILSNRTNRIYFFANNGKIKSVSPIYDFFDNNIIQYDPIDGHAMNEFYLSSSTHFKAINNHSVMFEKKMTNRSCFASCLNDQELYDYLAEDYYRINDPEDFQSIYEFYSTDPEYFGNFTGYFDNRMTFGGMTTYQTEQNNINVIWGDELGGVATWNYNAPTDAVDFSSNLESDENDEIFPLIQTIGNPKFMDNLTNISDYETKEDITINIVNVPVDNNLTVFANSYFIVDDDNDQSVTFPKLLNHPSFTVGIVSEDDQSNFSEIVYTNIDINDYDSDEALYISSDPDIEVHGHVPLNFDHPTWFQNITIYEGGELHIREGTEIHLTNTLTIYNNSSLHVHTNGVLTTQNLLNRNAEETINEPDQAAEIIVDGYMHALNMNIGYKFQNIPYDGKLQLRANGQHKVLIGYMEIGDYQNIYNYDGGYNSLLIEPENGLVNEYPGVIINYLQNCARLEIKDYVKFINGQFAVRGPSDFDQEGGLIIYNDGHLEISGCMNLVSNDYITIYPEGSLTLKNCSEICRLKDGSITYVDGELNVINTDVDIYGNNGGQIVSTLYLNGELNLSNHSKFIVHSSGVGIDGYDSGRLYLWENSVISGATAEIVEDDGVIPGDKIIIERIGCLQDPEMGVSHNITTKIISSSGQRWDGIEISKNDSYDEEYKFIDCEISGIKEFLFRGDTNIDIVFENTTFDDCTYGLHISGIDYSSNPVIVNLENCTFTNNHIGLYLHDDEHGNTSAEIKATNCVFGEMIEGDEHGNDYGCYLSDNGEITFESCVFKYNRTGLNSTYSNVYIGAIWNPSNPIQILPIGNTNIFTHNGSPIVMKYATGDGNEDNDSIIYDCLIENNNRSGIRIRNHEVRLFENTIQNNGGHGLWGEKAGLNKFEDNELINNTGSEFLGYEDIYDNVSQGYNLFKDDAYEIGRSAGPTTWLSDYEAWDKYILSYVTPFQEPIGDPADVRGNNFDYNGNTEPIQYSERFYPSYNDYIFDESISDSKELFDTGMNCYNNKDHSNAEITFKQVISEYPESGAAVSSLKYLYFLEHHTEKDYTELRSYLESVAPSDSSHLYKHKEELKTKTFQDEGDYITAIDRLEDVINDPATATDSIFAMIDQGYCYMELAESGERNLPTRCTVTTATIEEYTNFLMELDKLMFDEFNHDNTTPIIPFKLAHNFPNPFNPSTTINYAIPKESNVKLTIYNIKGQKVKILVNEKQERGDYSMTWNGSDKNNKRVASGIYFYKLETSKQNAVKKMLLLR